MWPTIGSLRTYIPVYVLALIVHGVLVISVGRRMGVSRRVGISLNASFIFGMCIGARVFYDVLHSRFEWWNYLELSYYFEDGLWGGPLAYLMVAVPGVVLFAHNRRALLDLIALTLPIPMMVAKVACVVNGCCYGAPSDLPWAVTYLPGAEAPAGIARHGTPIYEILVLGVILFVFHRLNRNRWNGRLLVWFVFLYGLGRPLTEVFRAPEEREPYLGPLTASQFVCLAASLVSGVMLLFFRARRDRLGRIPPDSSGKEVPIQLAAH